MTATTAIAADGLVKAYGPTRALDGLSLRVERGEFFGLLGPNGAGKTTFIETLVGLTEPTGGTASVFGHDVRHERRAVRARVGLAPQEYNVDRFFPIREVLEHKAGYHGFPRREAKRRAADALGQVGLTEKADATFKQLSGGMKRRCLLARALVTDPDLLILDEPTAGVDVQLRRDIWGVVSDLNDDGTTVLLTTHYIEEAERLCDRVCILNEGRAVEVDSPAELRRRGTDTYRVTVADPPVALDPLREMAGVERATATPDGVAVRARRGGRALPRLVVGLTDAGYTVEDVDIERASLEDVFVDLTRSGDGEGTGDATDGDAGEAGDVPPATGTADGDGVTGSDGESTEVQQ